ncbi:tetratricopeptide repeat protein [Sphingorhabdus sp. SMR4y]|uniref:tetratricopeptide repeat protein n=1 Tax=Sphingorhabdus sp. SMR4y TaxID=2584094 RepID=UPI000B5C8E55|nr:tetratricopeptide repeat protein [Sphingorhabdus sp. SMR4y]ASK88309.1 thioredoxin [Sphingorhabdus sp. SMR4y]
MATAGLTVEEQKAVEVFQREVVTPSMDKLVILDFWAEWCGPCKALAPMLEKVAAQYADKGVVLAKINVDENKFIAAQFQVQSIPTVYAIFQGKPVADLTSARSESQLTGALDQLLEQLPVGGGEEPKQDIAPLLAMGEEVLAEGDAERAAGVFAQIADMAPDNVEAVGGLIRALVAADHIEQAEAALAGLPDELRSDPAIERAQTTLQLAKDKPDAGALEALQAAVAANDKDHQARFDLASALIANGDHDAAAKHLLTIIAADKDWNEGAARQKLLSLFEMVGLEDEWVAATRRKLSAVLFG